MIRHETRDTRPGTFTYTSQVSGVTPKGFWMGHGAPQWSDERDIFIPRSMVIEADAELDDVEIGDELTVEIPLWLAREKGLTE